MTKTLAQTTDLSGNKPIDLSKEKIVFFEVKHWETAPIKKAFKGKAIVSHDVLSPSTYSQYKEATIVSTFINSELPASTLKQFPKLKLVTTRSTGFDHIDLDYCKKNDITVANVPSYGSNTVAEHAMALVLALMKRIPESMNRVKEGKFSPEDLTGSDLKGKIMGVVGTGSIGINTTKVAKGFGMRVIATDAYPNTQLEEALGFTYVEMDYLLKKADVISIHVPYLESTHHLINREAFAQMKKGVVIVNTSRGGIIETDALFDALREGKVGAAGLDVIEEEGFIKEELQLLQYDNYNKVDFKIALENHMMAYFPNVIITPHNAFNTNEALQRIIDTTIENIVSFGNGSPINLVRK